MIVHGGDFSFNNNNVYPTCIFFRIAIAIFTMWRGFLRSFRVGVSSIGRPLSIVYGNDEKGEFNGVGGVTGR